jgi:PPOX class probable F420-dependent enzyme
MTAATVTIPEEFMDLLTGRVFPVLVTLMPDNQPQASVIWASFDGTHIWVNTARNRQKDRNMSARPQVTLIWVDPKNPYRFIEVRGVVDEITEDGALDHINQLARRYRGTDDEYYAKNPGLRYRETRVIYKILPTRVIAH